MRHQDGLAIDLRVVEPEAFGAALQYFTGSKEHNVKVRELASRRGLRISEYGVFDEATGAVTLQYQSVADHGAGATVAIANQAGTDALQYSYNQSVIADGSAVRFTQGAK